jgi:hypothetical protein
MESFGRRTGVRALAVQRRRLFGRLARHPTAGTRPTLDPSGNAIACILLVFTVGTTPAALKLSKYRG